MKLTENFDSQEFVCPCCHELIVKPKLIELLQKLRDLTQSPILITSGYRCPKHNLEIGGASHSYHLRGMAADIKIPSMTPQEVAKLAEQIGFTGIGIYSSWTHVDVREGGPARW